MPYREGYRLRIYTFDEVYQAIPLHSQIPPPSIDKRAKKRASEGARLGRAKNWGEVGRG